ncbi:MAG: response regulator [Flavisolibacter sp.]
MRTQAENINVLIVEDNPSDLFLLEQMLLSSRLKIQDIYSAGRLSDAKAILQEKSIGLILLDLTLPDSFGIETFLSLKDKVQKIAVIILTGMADSDLAFEALSQGAQDYLVKGEYNVNLLIKSLEYSIERKRGEERILASEEKYRQIFYKSPFPMWINEPETSCILEVNDAAIKKYGYSREEFLQLTIDDIQRSCTVETPNAETAAQLCYHEKKNGEVIVVEYTGYPIDYYGRIANQAQFNDVTEKKRLERELIVQKQQIIKAVLNAQEKERKNIGAELHDNINQILTAIKISLGLALDDPAKNRDLVFRSMNNTSLAIEEIRKLSKALIVPGKIVEVGLIQSIHELIREISAVTRLKIDFNSYGSKDEILNEDQKIMIYRIVQEQLNNIIKHADASITSIELRVTEVLISLTIRDNGKGFDTRAVRKGIGITNIMSRAELFNGKVKIDSSPGNGCKLEVVMSPKLLVFTSMENNRNAKF